MDKFIRTRLQFSAPHFTHQQRRLRNKKISGTNTDKEERECSLCVLTMDPTICVPGQASILALDNHTFFFLSLNKINITKDKSVFPVHNIPCLNDTELAFWQTELPASDGLPEPMRLLEPSLSEFWRLPIIWSSLYLSYISSLCIHYLNSWSAMS